MEHLLWYDAPATDWEREALPIGDGRIGAMAFGAMAFGGVAADRVHSVTPEGDGALGLRSPLSGPAGRMRLEAEAGRTHSWKAVAE